MSFKVLVVDSDMTVFSKTVEFFNSIPGAEVSLNQHTDKSINCVRRYPYDLIVLGGKLNGYGDMSDVAAAIKGSRLNKQTTVICVSYGRSKAHKLAATLRPYSWVLDSTLDVVDEYYSYLKFLVESKEKKQHKINTTK